LGIGENWAKRLDLGLVGCCNEAPDDSHRRLGWYLKTGSQKTVRHRLVGVSYYPELADFGFVTDDPQGEQALQLLPPKPADCLGTFDPQRSRRFKLPDMPITRWRYSRTFKA
jgi:hypothetical protein